MTVQPTGQTDGMDFESQAILHNTYQVIACVGTTGHGTVVRDPSL
jgi:hypothetical protein